MTRIRNKTVKGILWNATSALFNQITLTLIAIVLTRILEPEDFGKIMMVTVITGFAGIIKDLGFGAALIRLENTTENHLSSSFWVNVALGASLTCLFYLLAPAVGAFYNDPELIPMVRFLSLNFVISSSAVVHSAMLRKNLLFKKISVIKFAIALLSGILAIVLAFLGFGVWALVYRHFSNTVIRTLSFWWVDKWKPKFQFHFGSIKELFVFSRNITATNMINYMGDKFDILIIGKFIGADALGLYNRALRFQRAPFTLIKGQIGSVIFPSLSKIQDDPKKQANIYLQLCSLLTFILFPVLVGLFCVAEEFVLILFQKKWIGLVPLFKIITVGSLFGAIGFPTPIFLVKNRTGLRLKLSMILRVVKVICILVGMYWNGMHGILMMLVVSILITSVVMNFYALKLLEVSIRKFLMTVVPIFIIVMLMGALIHGLDFMYFQYFKNEIQILLKAFTGATFYFLAVLIFKPKPLPYLIENYWPPSKMIASLRGRNQQN